MTLEQFQLIVNAMDKIQLVEFDIAQLNHGEIQLKPHFEI